MKVPLTMGIGMSKELQNVAKARELAWTGPKAASERAVFPSPTINSSRLLLLLIHHYALLFNQLQLELHVAGRTGAGDHKNWLRQDFPSRGGRPMPLSGELDRAVGRRTSPVQAC